MEYQGRPDSLVALRCVDPAGLQREALLWTRSAGEPIHLTLKPSEASDLPPGLTPIDWNVDPSAESFLKPVAEARLNGWEALAGFLQQQWPDKTGRVAVQLDTGTSLAVELGHPEVIESLVAHLQQVQQSSGARVGENTPFVAQVFGGSFDLRAGVILYTPLFQDAALEAAVWSGSLPLDRQTALELATSLTYLNAMEKEIHSLAGLEHFTALNRLYLGNNQIADITPLASLTNLEELYLGNNQIADITPLASLTNLRVLALNSNQIIDVRPLTTLIQLGKPVSGSNQITDVRPLTALTNLPYLYLDDNQITDVRPLAALTQLHTLYLKNNQIVDVNPLASLTNLQTLSLINNPVADVGPLTALTNLTDLNLAYNRIVDVTPLGSLTDLRSLVVSYNLVAQVSSLASLTNLRYLYLHNISPMTTLTNLERSVSGRKPDCRCEPVDRPDQPAMADAGPQPDRGCETAGLPDRSVSAKAGTQLD